MSHRGIKYNFEPGEYVLCFEPDCTKARVLYDAKVLDLTGSRDKRGNWKAEYTVHFQGWNSSWDRIVPETFVQKNSAENRALMKRLAVVARNVKSNRSRKRKIDMLLKLHFKRKMPPDSSDSSSDSDNSEDIDDDDDEDDDDEDLTDVDHFDEDQLRGNQSTTEDDTENAEDEESDEDKEYSDGLELYGPHSVELDIPVELRVKLEDDCYFINKKRKLVSLPAETNVLSLLEGHVKNFALNILYGTVEKPRTRDQQNNLPERNIELCKEVMDGIRIMFDFCLPSILLYNSERSNFEKAAANYKPMITLKKESEDTPGSPPPPDVTSPRLRSSTRHNVSPEGAGGGPNDTAPPLSPRGIKRERDEFSDDDIPPRRMTRHAYQTEIRCKKPAEQKQKSSSNSTSAEPCQGSTEKRRGGQSSRPEISDNTANETRRRESLRSSTRHSTELLHGTAAALGLAQKNVSLTDRVTPPPPLLIPSVISSKASKGSSSPHHTPTYKSRCSTPTLTDKEGMMNGVLSWKLIPDETSRDLLPSPSQICGAVHLLRLFVRMPELINQMAIPDAGIRPLVKHISLLLEYLADNHEEFFPETAYVDADSVHSGYSKR